MESKGKEVVHKQRRMTEEEKQVIDSSQALGNVTCVVCCNPSIPPTIKCNNCGQYLHKQCDPTMIYYEDALQHYKCMYCVNGDGWTTSRSRLERGQGLFVQDYKIVRIDIVYGVVVLEERFSNGQSASIQNLLFGHCDEMAWFPSSKNDSFKKGDKN